MKKWYSELNCAITVCDKDGKILEMNEKAQTTFAKWGGADLIGKNLTQCHNPHSQEMIKNLIQNNQSNTYTIEKNGVKKIIHQTPWYENNELKGLVEFSIEIPLEMPHFIR